MANPAVGEYLKEHPKLADHFNVEVYGTIGDKCLKVMKGTGVPFKVFQSKLGSSRLNQVILIVDEFYDLLYILNLFINLLNQGSFNFRHYSAISYPNKSYYFF